MEPGWYGRPAGTVKRRCLGLRQGRSAAGRLAFVPAWADARRSAARLHRSGGNARARLTMDSENPTGATRLYERAGMSVELAWEHWEKELRRG